MKRQFYLFGVVVLVLLFIAAAAEQTVKVGDDAMTATATVVTSDVPDGALAIGRSKQENRPGLAVKLYEKFKAAKAARQKGV